MILKKRSSSSIPVWLKSNGICFKTELQKPCWRVAVRRWLGVFPAPLMGAEPVLGFLTIRLFFARQSLPLSIVLLCPCPPVLIGLPHNPQLLQPPHITSGL